MDVEAASEIADEAMGDLVSDPDLFTCLGISPAGTKYPVRHSTHACMLALSIGMHLRLDRPTLKELAIGCLVHDAGMLRIDQRVFLKQGPLDRSDFLEITKHPSIVFDMLMDVPKIPKRAAFIAYQMHERCNGTGYPRRRDGSQIYFLSKIAAAADTFVALVSPRPHRPGLLPYHAMETLIRSAHAGEFDPIIVRALLHTVSLFPIGSCVELSDGRVGRVLRTNGDVYHRPIVELPAAVPDVSSSPVIDLLEHPDLEIVCPAASCPAPAASEFAVMESPT
jgi:HD-GYP domain-containing protein (c-di-GMP phosphodiesterase class II)